MLFGPPVITDFKFKFEFVLLMIVIALLFHSLVHVRPSPVYPCLQAHSNDPGKLLQTAFT